MPQSSMISAQSYDPPSVSRQSPLACFLDMRHTMSRDDAAETSKQLQAAMGPDSGMCAAGSVDRLSAKHGVEGCSSRQDSCAGYSSSREPGCNVIANNASFHGP